MDETRNSSDDELIELPDSFVFETNLTTDSSDNSDSKPTPAPQAVEEIKGNAPASAEAAVEPKEEEEEPTRVISDTAEELKPPLNFEIVIKPPPIDLLGEYTLVQAGDEVYQVLEKIPPTVPGESWFKVEYDDGHVDIVTFDDLQHQPNGRQAWMSYVRPNTMDWDEADQPETGFDDQALKRKAPNDSDYEVGGEGEEDDLMQDAINDGESEDGFMLPGKRRRLQRASTNSSGLGLRRSTRERRTAVPSDHDDDDDDDSDNDQPAGNGVNGYPKSRFILRNKPKPRLGRKGMFSSSFSRDDDADELAQDPEPDQDRDAGDGDFKMVTSDLQPTKRPRGGKRIRGGLKSGRGNKLTSNGYRDSSIEFEPPRRSGRANKATKNMQDPMLDYEIMMDVEEDKPIGAPKVAGAKEVFQSLEESEFKDVHCMTCNTCGNGPSTANKGTMIYCQGCSTSYHKVCLGYRTTREHIVTKIGPQCFVLQCRHCVGSKKKADVKLPSLDICTGCKEPGPACAPFAPKRTAKQEEKLREENNGEDPVTKVAPNLINNADNVLFRCTQCRRAWHYEHLPQPSGQEDNIMGDNVRAERIAEYSIEWKCKDCTDMPHKIAGLVAWRPIDRESYIPGQTTLDLVEDAKEYLVRWDTMSYAHCQWKPGPWVWGVTTAAMRSSFPKRNEGENLLPKWDTNEAVPEEYLLADVILAVRFKGNVRFQSKEADIHKIPLIDQVKVKFQGLDYTEAVWDEPPSPDSGDLWAAFVAAYQEFLNGKHFKSEPISTIKTRISQFREQDFTKDIEFDTEVEPMEQPMGLKRGKLMKYQIQGLNWLLSNFVSQRNVVLADEMGLGKTIQVVALIAALALQGPRCWPFLVVVPNSTCPNWRREIKQWAPDLRVVTYHGGREAQKLAYDHELFPDGSREMKAHVVVMSYDSAQDDHTKVLFKSVNWVGLVVDEGQRLKNDSNLLYGALRAMKISFRLLLTGTPLQNNKRELFNLLQFVDHKLNAVKLDEEYADITVENITKLHELIRPFFLRRTKAQVLKFLPPMAQIILPVSMSVVQERLCKSIIEKNPDLIRAIFAKTKVKTTERSSLNNILMQLRKCLCHPFIYSGAVEDKTSDPETMHRNLIEASSKLVLLEVMLPKLKERGHRVLLFSQFLGQLDIVEDFMTGMGYKFQRLDGNIGSLEKQKRIDSFNEPGSEDFAFLLTTRAGGVGINLATADTVIIMDPDFNPHQDIQALSRAHRIGQKNKVLCFQLMTKSSVEEKIMQIGRKKMALDHALIESMDNKDEDAGNDLESILKHGAQALFGEDEKEIIKYDAASVDKLLDRSSIENTKTDADKSAESQFSYARVWANDKGDLADDIGVNDEPVVMEPSAWDAIIKEREEEAAREAEAKKEVLGRGGRRRQKVKYTGENHEFGEPQTSRVAGDEDSDVDDDFVSSEGSGDESDGEVGDTVPEQGSMIAPGVNLRKLQDKKTSKVYSDSGQQSLKGPDSLSQGPQRSQGLHPGQQGQHRVQQVSRRRGRLSKKPRQGVPDQGQGQQQQQPKGDHPQSQTQGHAQNQTPNPGRGQGPRPAGGPSNLNWLQPHQLYQPGANPVILDRRVGKQPQGYDCPDFGYSNGLQQGRPQPYGPVPAANSERLNSAAIPAQDVQRVPAQPAVSSHARATNPSLANNQKLSSGPVMQRPPKPCQNCATFHLSSMPCVRLDNEIDIRLAIDNLSRISPVDQRLMAILKEKLKEAKLRASLARGRQSQRPPQPIQRPPPVQRTPFQKPPVQKPNEPINLVSDSEEESESGSGSGSLVQGVQDEK